MKFLDTSTNIGGILSGFIVNTLLQKSGRLHIKLNSPHKKYVNDTHKLFRNPYSEKGSEVFLEIPYIPLYTLCLMNLERACLDFAH